ncbi:MAG TPA: hypothetical protein PLD12_08615, partial [Bacteroidales bacterium]|nr:hypothetical protein [Bacteroidales bacterium]
MNKLTLFCITLFMGILLFPGKMLSQTPVVDGINYQAVALDENRKEIAGHDIYGTVFFDKEIVVRFSIIRDKPDGTVVYSETHTTLTDAYGLFSLTIGHGQPLVGRFSDIRWGEAPHFLKVELDYKRNGEFLLMGIQQLMAVPYAMHALSAKTILAEEKDPIYSASPASGITDAGSGKVITDAERNLIRNTDSLTQQLNKQISAETNERRLEDRALRQKQQSDSIHFQSAINNEVALRQQENIILSNRLNQHLTDDKDTSTTNELQQLFISGNTQPQITLSKGGGTLTLKATGSTTLNQNNDTIIISSSDLNSTYTAGNGLQLNANVFAVKTKGNTLHADSAGLAISPEGIGTSELADGSVTTAKLADGAVSSLKLADNSVTSAKIADGTITNADISNSAAIADSKLATISTAGKVANSATSATASNNPNTIVLRDASGNFSADTITANLNGTASMASAIADNTVTSPKIVDGSITATDLADGSVTTPKLADGSVTTAKLADGAVSSLKIADNSVTSAKIADGTITNAD